jgi:alkylhydroperoxidase family enzyme
MKSPEGTCSEAKREAEKETDMAWVRTFDESEAAGRLADVYAELKKASLARGRVPNIMKCMGLRPEALMGVWQLNMAITFGASTLGRRREEMIATAVSALNHCHY